VYVTVNCEEYAPFSGGPKGELKLFLGLGDIDVADSTFPEDRIFDENDSVPK
jgi:hypothetical protein